MLSIEISSLMAQLASQSFGMAQAMKAFFKARHYTRTGQLTGAFRKIPPHVVPASR